MLINNKAIFEKVRKHLLTQGRRATYEALGPCRYRAPNGDMCAVGCLIPDERYSPALEGKAARNPPLLEAVFGTSQVHDDTVSLLCKLQDIHDTADPDHWDEYLRLVALYFFGPLYALSLPAITPQGPNNA